MKCFGINTQRVLPLLAWWNNFTKVVMYYTYILQSEKDSKFYSGFTEDVKLRPAPLNPEGKIFDFI